jgi:hypothetical protein
MQSDNTAITLALLVPVNEEQISTNTNHLNASQRPIISQRPKTSKNKDGRSFFVASRPKL